jgi:NAD(P)H-dependent FMN reductase
MHTVLHSLPHPGKRGVAALVTTSTPKLAILVTSTRPGRLSLPIASWFREQALAHGRFDVEWVDLAEWNLPFMDEPHHPRLRQYTHEHTRRWSAAMEAADAFVLVTPEYNHGFTAPLKNAIDYLIHEWAHKPVGFVSYGGLSAGTRAVQLLKPILIDLKMTPIVEAVNVPFVHQHMVDGAFAPPEALVDAARLMLDEIERAEATLRPQREAARSPVGA